MSWRRWRLSDSGGPGDSATATGPKAAAFARRKPAARFGNRRGPGRLLHGPREHLLRPLPLLPLALSSDLKKLWGGGGGADTGRPRQKLPRPNSSTAGAARVGEWRKYKGYTCLTQGPGFVVETLAVLNPG